jgi:WNK lysine deficient protein kinase
VTKVEFRLRVVDPKKRSNKYKENEAIQFEFDIINDNPEEVAQEMVKTGLLVEEDSKLVGKMLRSQVSGLSRERDERRNKTALLSELLHLQVPPDSHFHPDNLHGQLLRLKKKF